MMWTIVKILRPWGWGKWFDVAIYNANGTSRLIQCCKNKNGIKVFRDVAIGLIFNCDAHTSGITLKEIEEAP